MPADDVQRKSTVLSLPVANAAMCLTADAIVTQLLGCGRHCSRHGVEQQAWQPQATIRTHVLNLRDSTDVIWAYVSAAVHSRRRLSRLAFMGRFSCDTVGKVAGCLRTGAWSAADRGLDSPLDEWLMVSTCALVGRVCMRQQQTF